MVGGSPFVVAAGTVALDSAFTLKAKGTCARLKVDVTSIAFRDVTAKCIE